MKTTINVHSRIYDWSLTAPAWQRDALRRIITIDALTEADIRELADLCKENAKTPIVLTAKPLELTHLPQQGNGTDSVWLKSIGSLNGVNRLASNQTLEFTTGPSLTIIYGDNGTGKSGYARVLKSACRCRGSAPSILHDIYSPKPASVANASIEYEVNGASSNFTWMDQQSTEPLLTNVFVFDTQSAEHYVNSHDTTAFSPFGLDILKKLADVSDRVAKQLKTDKAANAQKQDDKKNRWSFSPTTEVGKFIQKLSAKTTDIQLDELAGLTADQVQELAELNETLKADPVKKSRETVASTGRLKLLLSGLKEVKSLFAPQNLANINNLIEAHTKKTDEIKAFKDEFFSKDFLNGTGSESWIALWEAAKKYSADEAYAGLQFPQLDEAKCVLCQQDLDPSAQQRFKEFEQFVDDKLQAQLNTIKRDLRVKYDEIVQVNKLTPSLLAAKADLEDAMPGRFEQIEIACKKLDNDLTTLLKNMKSLTVSASLFEQSALIVELEAVCVNLESRAQKELSANDPDARSKLSARKLELEDRQKLQKEKQSILDFIQLCVKENNLNAAIKLTNTSKITKKNGELVQACVTNPFCKRFDDEISALGVDSIQVKMASKRGKKAELKFGIELIDVASKTPREIASEGEQRCLALAAFFAELAQAEHQSALVFDDPVSSLDINYRKQIGIRLVKEAKARQVVVFTHDALFLNELSTIAEAETVPLSQCYIEWANGKPGVIQAGVPWACQTPDERTKALDAVLQKLKSTWNPVPSEKNKSDIAKAYSNLRSTLERVVEAIVFNGAIERYNPYIDLKRLKTRVDLDDTDELELNRLFKKCCDVTDAHDKPRAAQGVTAKPTDFQQDLKDTKKLIQALKGKKRPSR